VFFCYPLNRSTQVLTGAEFDRLSLRDSQVRSVETRGLVLHGDLDIRGLQSPNTDGYCYGDFRRSTIRGTIRASGARLRAPVRALDERSPNEGDTRWALSLADTVVDGSVVLQPFFHADGGVCLNAARIEGSIWAGGASIRSGEAEAVDGQSMRLGGNLLIRSIDPTSKERDDFGGEQGPHPARITGSLWFWGARIEGTVQLSGTVLSAPEEEDRSHSSIQARGAEVVLTRSVINGSLLVSVSSWPALGSGDWLRFTSEDAVHLSGATIRGDLDIRGSRFKTLFGDGLTVVGDILADRSGSNVTSSVPTEVRGWTLLRNAKIGGSLRLGGWWGSPGPSGGVDLQGASVDGSVLIDQNQFLGHLRMPEAKVRGKLSLQRTWIRGGLYASLLQTEGDLVIEDALLGRTNDLRQVEVGGHLRLIDAQIRRGRLQQRAQLTLQDARIAGELHVAGLASETGQKGSMTRALRHPVRLRSHDLRCYPAMKLVEISTDVLLDRAGKEFGTERLERGVAGFLFWKSGRALPLSGRSILFHRLNALGMLDLSSLEAAREYLYLFGSYVWGDDGAFQIIGPDDPVVEGVDPDRLARMPGMDLGPAPEGQEGYIARAPVLYKDTVYEAKFAVTLKGQVQMLSDRALFRVHEETSRFFSPFRFLGERPGAEFPRTIGGIEGWRYLNPWDEPAQELLADLEEWAEPERQAAGTPPLVALGDVRVDRLDDADGEAWGDDVQLSLDGLEYERAPTRTSRGPRPNKGEFVREMLGATLTRTKLEASVVTLLAIRKRPLSFYPGWSLVEAEVEADLGLLDVSRG